MRNICIPLLAVFFSLLIMGQAFAASTFKDVKPGHSAYDELEFLAEQKIISPDTKGVFQVTRSITRLEASEMIVKALKLDVTNRPAPAVVDVKPGDKGYDIIATVIDERIMSGNAKGQFMPNEPLTRVQMAAILVKAFHLQGTSTYSFRDVSDTHWASEAIKTLFANQVTTGYLDNTYKPSASLSRGHFGLFLARIVESDFKKAVGCYAPDNEKKYVVNTAVTTLWKEPNKARAVDAPAVSSPVDIKKWTKTMAIPQKQWLVGKIETQALYGQEVSILKTSGDWVQIAVKNQFSPKSAAGYPGWVPKSHITETYPNYKKCEIAMVSKPTAFLYSDASFKQVFMQVSINTILPVLQKDGNRIQVQTPSNGVKWFAASDIQVLANEKAIPRPDSKQIMETAKQFEGLSYLWAGTSGFGLDCSGFTYTVYKQNGITLPRDSSVQAVNGTAVAKKDMQPGDLLFYSHNKGKGAVHHVSMYIGNGKMIHSPNPKKSVEIISIQTEPYKSELSGIRRYLK